MTWSCCLISIGVQHIDIDIATARGLSVAVPYSHYCPWVPPDDEGNGLHASSHGFLEDPPSTRGLRRYAVLGELGKQTVQHMLSPTFSSPPFALHLTPVGMPWHSRDGLEDPAIDSLSTSEHATFFNAKLRISVQPHCRESPVSPPPLLLSRRASKNLTLSVLHQRIALHSTHYFLC